MKLENRLRDLHKHANQEFPVSNYVGLDKFPEQNEMLLNTIIRLEYRDMEAHNSYLVDPLAPAHRPLDDESAIDPTESQEYEENSQYTESGIFRVIRCDKEEPFVMVCISADYTKVITCDSRTFDQGAAFVMHQEEDYMYNGALVKPYFTKNLDDEGAKKYSDSIPMKNYESNEHECFVISFDTATRLGYGVVIEIIDSDKFRVLLDSEVDFEIIKLYEYDTETSRESQIANLRKRLIFYRTA